MRAEILCVGSELLLGQIIDTNAAYIATQLAAAGVDVHRKQTVGDNLERIVDCIRGALSRTDALIITGGLGPTTDDLTREAIALAVGRPLLSHPELEKQLLDFFASRGLVPVASNLRQAQLPEGATAIPNPIGTAPGVRFESDNTMIFAVPGVPREMRLMLDNSIVPALLERDEGQHQIIVSRVLRCFGVGESSLAEPLEDILTTATNPTVAPLLYQNTEVHIRLTAKAPDTAAAAVLLDAMEARVRERIGAHIFAVNEQTMAQVVVDLLRRHHLTVAVAESVTGGLVNAALTDVPGASEVLRGGVVAYSEAMKQQVLGVPAQTLEQDGVVSAATAAAMARGVREAGRAAIGLSTTGEAGPESASGAEVGTVYIGLAAGDQLEAGHHSFFGERDLIRKRATLAALNVLRRHLLKL